MDLVSWVSWEQRKQMIASETKKRAAASAEDRLGQPEQVGKYCRCRIRRQKDCNDYICACGFVRLPAHGRSHATDLQITCW